MQELIQKLTLILSEAKTYFLNGPLCFHVPLRCGIALETASCAVNNWHGGVCNAKIDQSTLLFLMISLFEFLIEAHRSRLSAVERSIKPVNLCQLQQQSNLSTFETFLATVSCQAPVISKRPLLKKVYRPSFSKVSNSVFAVAALLPTVMTTWLIFAKFCVFVYRKLRLRPSVASSIDRCGFSYDTFTYLHLKIVIFRLKISANNSTAILEFPVISDNLFKINVRQWLVTWASLLSCRFSGILLQLRPDSQPNRSTSKRHFFQTLLSN